MTETFRRAYEHRGASFVEIYQNCNVFNDGAFAEILAKDKRPEMLIPLRHGEPVRFGENQEHGVALNRFGEAEVVDVATVGEDALLVHDEHRADPALAFALSRLADQPTTPTPIGVFREVQRPVYEEQLGAQLVAAQERSGPGDLRSLIESAPTWEVTADS
jgi:2-oxoglutarate ferredoxin oxidoreductase subunit beta